MQKYCTQPHVFLSLKCFNTKERSIFSRHLFYTQTEYGYMNLLKQICFRAGLLLCCVTAIFSCSLNDDEPDLIYLTLGTVTNDGRLKIESDSHGTLVPSNPERFAAADADETGQRVLISVPANEIEADVQEGGEKEVNVVELYKVLTKDADDLRITRPENGSDTDFGNDPLQIIGVSISAQHLNVQLYIKGHNTEKPHRISLLLDEGCQIDENGWLPVELRHNAGQDSQSETFWSVVSFKLSSIPEYESPAFEGFHIYYNNGTNKHAECFVRKGQILNQDETFSDGLFCNSR